MLGRGGASAAARCAQAQLTSRVTRCCYTRAAAIQEHDVVLLRQKIGLKRSKKFVSQPLRKDGKLKLGFGASVKGSDIIGKTLPSVVKDTKGNELRVDEVTLAQYISNIPRVATPIYPQDASMIASILDINLPVPGEDAEFDAGPRYEIFEAGTGMGSLSLQIAKSLHAANPPVPQPLKKALLDAPYKTGQLSRCNASETNPVATAPYPHEAALDSEALQDTLASYRASRKAVLHTLDINPTTSRQAHGVIKGFKRGRYMLDMDFHVRTVKAYIEPRLAESGRAPFLDHAVLDLPGATEHAGHVVEALKPGGRLVVFFPSVTQVLEFVVWAEEGCIGGREGTRTVERPLYMEKVIELAPGSWTTGFSDGIGGREWDVRAVVTRKDLRKKAAAAAATAAAAEVEDEGGLGRDEEVDETAGEAEAAGDEGPQTKVHVCRPKVGTLVGGGGFLAVFTKKMIWEVEGAAQAETTGPASPSPASSPSPVDAQKVKDVPPEETQKEEADQGLLGRLKFWK